MKTTYAIVGASSRALEMFAKPLAGAFADVAVLAGVCDINPERARYFIGAACPGVPFYADFDRMIAEAKPDCVIVATVDAFHHEYIIRALDLGCDVITEKPMTIDDEKCNAILEAERRNGRKIRVTFNARFLPLSRRIRELLLEGAIGDAKDIYHVNMEWLLDTSHGADYFRRWHRRKENSGGLLVHKSTHHFDKINWWIGQTPDTVYARGTTKFYGPARDSRGERCLDCPHKKTCEFAFALTEEPIMQGLYFGPEKADGYRRDGCVFSPEIDIEDNMALTVTYKEGALLTYSLVAHSPYEGFRLTISGKGGRLEAQVFYSGRYAKRPDNIINIYNRRGEEITVSVPKAEGAHGGADVRLLEMLFRPGTPDPLKQSASSEAGIHSVMIGVCANKSIKDGKAHRIDDLIRWQ
jgi:predicted dehydrogenase